MLFLMRYNQYLIHFHTIEIKGIFKKEYLLN